MLALTNSKSKCCVYFSLLVPFLRFFVYLQGIQGNQKKVFTITCEDLLGPLLTVRTLLISQENGTFIEELTGDLDDIIKQLFNKYDGDHNYILSEILSGSQSHFCTHSKTLFLTGKHCQNFHLLLPLLTGFQPPANRLPPVLFEFCSPLSTLCHVWIQTVHTGTMCSVVAFFLLMMLLRSILRYQIFLLF